MATPNESTKQYLMESSDEIQRLSFNHYIMKDAMGGKLVLAPIDFDSSPLKILDSATADGLWLRDFAKTAGDDHTFVGTDLLEAQFPKQRGDNFQYQVQDINKPWPEDWAARFDLVHQRLGLASSGRPESAKAVIARMCALVKPGGWIQLIEAEDVHDPNDGPAWKISEGLIRDVLAFMGAKYGVIEDIPGWLTKFGFTDVQKFSFEVKYGAKNESEDKELKDMGVKVTKMSVAGLAGFGKTFPQEKLSMPKEKLDTLAEDVADEAGKQGNSMFMQAVWGKKSER